MITLKLTLKFIKADLKRVILLFFLMVIGTAIFYFIIIGASSLENKIIRLSQNGAAELNVPFLLSNEEDLSEILSFNEEDLNELREELLEIEGIELVSYSFYSTFKRKGSEINLIGINFETGIDLFDFKENFLTYPHNNLPKSDYKVKEDYDFEGVIGTGLAIKINNELSETKAHYKDIVGEVITVTDPLNQKHKMKITGIVYTDIPTIKGNSIIVDIKTIEKMNLNLPTINRLEIRTSDKLKSSLLKRKVEPLIKEKLDERLTVFDWREDNPLIVNLVYVERVSLVMIQLLTAFAISIGIMNVLFIGVKGKTSQIGIIKAMGLKNSKTVNVFLNQTLIISLFSIIIGLFLGYFLTIQFQELFQSGDGLPLIMMNKNILNRHTLITFLALFTFSLLGSILPLLSVKRMKIIDIITSE
ncbi:MAG: FtsX-like permease family protein [Acholeplasmataceae bacterium]|nr:FtsX-like permease family protein [Acholeplasmataceae bacterium]